MSCARLHTKAGSLPVTMARDSPVGCLVTVRGHGERRGRRAAPAHDIIACDFTQISAESPETRRLTVSYGPFRVRGPDGRAMSVPLLRLQGAWLERAGFETGAPVKVHVSRGRLVIEAAEPERIPKADILKRIARVSEGELVRPDGLLTGDRHRRCAALWSNRLFVVGGSNWRNRLSALENCFQNL